MLFSDNIPKILEIKDFNTAVRGGRVHLKLFPGSEAVQLNHHVKTRNHLLMRNLQGLEQEIFGIISYLLSIYYVKIVTLF